MSDWPELERRLLESARHRSGRRWRSWARLTLVPTVVTLAAVALVALLRSPDPSDERSVRPGDERAATATVAGDSHRNPAEPTGPGRHGTRLDALAYGNRTLLPGTVNRLSYDVGKRFTVVLTNEGANDEFNVKVTVRVRSVDFEAVTSSRTLPAISAKEQQTVEIVLDREPPLSQAATIDVTVAKVPGEKTDDPQDNNRLSFPALFSDEPEVGLREPEASAPPTSSDTAVKPVALAELRDTQAVRADLASGGELARAWAVPALKGHVHLIRKPNGWCISVPDPLTDQPELERGKTCTDSATFADRGIQIGIGSTLVSVGADPDAPLIVDV